MLQKITGWVFHTSLVSPTLTLSLGAAEMHQDADLWIPMISQTSEHLEDCNVSRLCIVHLQFLITSISKDSNDNTSQLSKEGLCRKPEEESATEAAMWMCVWSFCLPHLTPADCATLFGEALCSSANQVLTTGPPGDSPAFLFWCRFPHANFREGLVPDKAAKQMRSASAPIPPLSSNLPSHFPCSLYCDFLLLPAQCSAPHPRSVNPPTSPFTHALTCTPATNLGSLSLHHCPGARSHHSVLCPLSWVLGN